MTTPQWINFGGEDIPNAPLESARCVVLPLCYEDAPSYGQGSARGPLYLLHASAQLERTDEETLTDWAAFPIHTAGPIHPASDPETAVSQIKTAAGGILFQRKFLLSLGGDHAVSIGTIAAAAEIFPDMGVLQIDAHLDLRETWNGSRFNHGCVMRRVLDDLGLPVFPVGTRAVAPEELELLNRGGVRPVWAHQIAPGDSAWVESVVDLLPPRVYLTVDLDGLDPSAVPGTGTPEPGGLSYRQATALIRCLSRRREVVAADVVELAPFAGSQVSEYTAARIAQKIIHWCCSADAAA
jgi:agmatinase